MMRKTFLMGTAAAALVLAACERPVLGTTWNTNTYTVTYHLGIAEGTPPEADTFTRGDPELFLPAPEVGRDDFTGWYTALEGGTWIGGAGDPYTPTANITLYAHWRNGTTKHTVTFDPQLGDTEGGDKGTEFIQAAYGDTLQPITIPKRPGYSFVGYFSSQSGMGIQYYQADGKPVNKTSTFERDITLYALWKIGGDGTTFTVTFNWQGGQDNPTATLSVQATIDYDMPPIIPPVRTGYLFSGYWTEKDGAGTQYYKADGTSAQPWKEPGDMTLYAYWEAGGYTVTLDPQGGSGGTTVVQAAFGSAMPSITPPVRPDYTFTGYFDQKNGAGTQYYKADGTSKSNWDKKENATLYAAWTTDILLDPSTFNLSTLTGTGDGWSYANSELRVKNGANLTLTGSTPTTRVVIEKDVTARVTLYEVMIDFLREDWPTTTVWSVSPLKLEKGANLTLLLSGTNIFTAAGHAAALNAPEGTTLTITSVAGDGSESGVLSAQVGDDTWMGRSNHGRGSEGAGIGGNDGENGGDITIKGGFVTGRCFGHGAGIGGGMNGHAGTITITGGAVRGYCDWWDFEHGYNKHSFFMDGFGGAGIGAGGTTGVNKKYIPLVNIPWIDEADYDRAPAVWHREPTDIAGSIVITGGRIDAWGGQDAAAIGGSAAWVYPAKVMVSGDVRMSLGSGVSFWGGNIYLVGPGHQDYNQTDDPVEGTIDWFGSTDPSPLRMGNGTWKKNDYDTHRGAGGYMENKTGIGGGY